MFTKCWPNGDGDWLCRTDPCSNPRNTNRRGMEPNHPELGLDPDVARMMNRVQTPKKTIPVELIKIVLTRIRKPDLSWAQNMSL